jgi:hypothetical protein
LEIDLCSHRWLRALGKTEPVADNTPAAGRKLNRRVDLVVSSEAIGQQIGR